MDSLIKKFKFKDLGIVINAPQNWGKSFAEFGFKTNFDPSKKSTNTLVFINNKKEFVDFLDTQISNIESDSVLWFAYPKGTSKIKTDINRDILRLTAEEFNITTVAAISIDDTWSALRFRPIEKVGKFNKSIFLIIFVLFAQTIIGQVPPNKFDIQFEGGLAFEMRLFKEKMLLAKRSQI